MDPAKKIEETAKGTMETLGKVYEKLPSMKDVIKLIENKQTEFRLKFENLTLDGDIALAITLIKEEKTE
ncbi:MAG: hypothetical protein JSW00_03320 [Thermoplasmata archaeon]|nr:MAG: hypothetical protein JSW00_03320 [Thermoplasmata archaeon]